MENEQPHDAVELVRAIRDRHYEETRHMTREEKRAHDDQRINKNVAEFKELMASVDPSQYDFSWLHKK